jgi:hypothetical protein
MSWHDWATSIIASNGRSYAVRTGGGATVIGQAPV